MKNDIKSLLRLQERDLELDRLKGESAAIPSKIASIQAQTAAAKTALEEAKRELTQLQLARKQKELDLETQEAAIRKHSTELNAVKTNEAYRALLGEIEKAKKDKSALEDHILQIMEQIDQANRGWKEKESALKTQEAVWQKEMSDWQAKQLALEQQSAEKQAEREQAAGALDNGLLEQYERLRQGRRGAVAIVPIRNEQCSGCHMKVSQNLINEVRRSQKLMACESCSRIVYLEEVLAA